MWFRHKPSIITKVTMWYSGFIVLLVGGMLALAFVVSNQFVDTSSRRELLNKATMISTSPEYFQRFDDSIFYSIYDRDGNVYENNLPKEFDKNAPNSNGQISTYSRNGKTYLYVDIATSDNRGWIRAVMLQTDANKELTLLFQAIMIICPIILVVVVVGGYRILKKAFEPVDEISRTALEIQKNQDFSKRIELGDSRDELHRLSETFNAMLDSIETSFQREKQFNNNVSHELRTPVAVILSESEYGARYIDEVAESKESFEVIKKQAIRMRDLITQILELSKVETTFTKELQPLDLSNLVQDKIAEYDRLCSEQNIQLQAVIDAGVYVMGDELLLGRLLDNLVGNAMKFTKDSIIIRLQGSSLYVEDNGIGIASQEKEKIWHRFYQTEHSRNKEQKQGSGLGLSFVKKIVEIHHATIQVVSEQDQGACFSVLFPEMYKVVE